MNTFHQFPLYLHTGAYTEKDGKGDHGWRSCGWRCCLSDWWASWHWIGACIEKVGFIPYHSQKSSSNFSSLVYFLRFFVKTSCDMYHSLSFLLVNIKVIWDKKCSCSNIQNLRFFLKLPTISA